MKRIVIADNDAGQRVDKFLQKLLKNMPKGLMFRYLRTGHIKLNRKKPAPGDKLVPGDVLELYIADEFFEKKKHEFIRGALDIAYEDENILVINKPTGLACQPDKAHKESVVGFVRAYLYDTGVYDPDNENSFAPSVLNRLDVNTRGLVIASKNAHAGRVISAWIKAGLVRKFYRTVTVGVPDKKSDELVGYLYKDEKKNKSTIYEREVPHSRYVETHYSVVSHNGKNALVDIELITGRPHQIRAHMAHIGHPLVNDFKYGGGHGHQLLCAYKLVFTGDDTDADFLYLKNKTIEVDPKICL